MNGCSTSKAQFAVSFAVISNNIFPDMNTQIWFHVHNVCIYLFYAQIRLQKFYYFQNETHNKMVRLNRIMETVSETT